MIGAQDISAGFALDAQSVGKLRLQSKREPDAALKAVAQQFEGIFLNMMLKSMREASPQEGLFDSEQSKLFTQLFDQQLAQKLSSGKGIGLADMMIKQLTRSGMVVAGQTQEILSSSGVVPDQSKQTDSPQPMMQQVIENRQSTAPAFNTPKEFVDAMWPHAVEAGKELGVAPQLLLAHAALESGWGRRQILGADGKSSHNLFGIKASAKWDGDVVNAATTEYSNGVPQNKREPFRAYASYEESFRDYAALLQGNRYREVLGQARDAAGFARALQQAGYATDPMYASKLARVANSETMRQALAG